VTSQSVTGSASGIDWDAAVVALDRDGYAIVPKLLRPDACATVSSLYEAPDRFRSRIVMARHGFGQGEYQYFSYPLPPTIDAIRRQAYGPLAQLANLWCERLGQPAAYPETVDAFLKECHEAGQKRPTPLLLRYGPGDFNRLHQDLYGDVFFPIQLAILLNQPGRDFEGGEFVLTEARPRMQSRAIVVPLAQGDGVVFAVNQRPVQGTRGFYRAQMRHGVSTIRSGRRHTLGVIFHDAR
jgi:hypothetical protein